MRRGVSRGTARPQHNLARCTSPDPTPTPSQGGARRAPWRPPPTGTCGRQGRRPSLQVVIEVVLRSMEFPRRDRAEQDGAGLLCLWGGLGAACCSIADFAGVTRVARPRSHTRPIFGCRCPPWPFFAQCSCWRCRRSTTGSAAFRAAPQYPTHPDPLFGLALHRLSAPEAPEHACACDRSWQARPAV